MRLAHVAPVLALAVAALAPPPCRAAEEKRIVVLDFTGALPKDVCALLSDQARGAAAAELRGRGGYSVITRENVALILRDNTSAGACTEGECEIDIARSVGADLVVSGQVSQIESTWLVTLKLHETQGGRLLDARNATGKGQLDLIRAVQAQTSGLLHRGLQLSGQPRVVDGLAEADVAPDVPEPGAVHVRFRPPSEGERWIVMDEGKRLCSAPCARWVAPGSEFSMRHEADRPENVWTVRVPSTLPYSEGTQLEATPLRARSWVPGAIFGAAAGFGLGYVGGRLLYDAAEQGSTCADIGRTGCGVAVGILPGALMGSWIGGLWWQRSPGLDVRRSREPFVAAAPRGREPMVTWFVSPYGAAVAGRF